MLSLTKGELSLSRSGNNKQYNTSLVELLQANVDEDDQRGLHVFVDDQSSNTSPSTLDCTSILRMTRCTGPISLDALLFSLLPLQPQETRLVAKNYTARQTLLCTGRTAFPKIEYGLSVTRTYIDYLEM